MISEKEKYLGYLRKILDPSARAGGEKEPTAGAQADPLAAAGIAARIPPRSKAEQETLLDRFRKESKNLFQKVQIVKEAAEAGAAIAELIRQKTAPGAAGEVAAWNHPFIRALGMEKSLRACGICFFHPPFDPDHRQAAQARLSRATAGITTADYALAETGSLALLARPDQPRAVFMLPPIHIAILQIEQFIRNLAELYVLLRAGGVLDNKNPLPGLTVVSGVSRTGDIEAVPVFGAHGPKEVHIFVIHSGADSSR